MEVTGLHTKALDGVTLTLVPLDPAGREDDRLTARIEGDKARFRGLQPRRRYLLWGRLAGLDWHVYAEVDAGATSIVAALERGGTIRGRVLAHGATHEGIHVVLRGPAFWIVADPDADGRFVLHAVPKGEWTIEARCYGAESERTASVRARSGDVVEIALRSP